ncbi:MAG: DUF3078 domain-containing protein [Saprospiraceae bacterium]
MKKVLYFLLISTGLSTLFAQADNAAAQEAERKKLMDASMKMEEKDGWIRKGALGLDLGQLANINPYVGGGSNRLGVGGAIAYKAILKKGLFRWNNDFNINYSAQRIGSGTLGINSNEKVPFEKALDILTLSSNLAYKVNKESHWAYSTDLFFLSQFTGSYKDSANNKIYLKDLHTAPYNTTLVSKLFSPANITFAIGMKYQKKENWYLFLSPVALKSIIVSDQAIANLGVHGTKKKENSSDYNKSLTGIGALARGGYTAKIYNRIILGSELLLFSDYLDNPQNIDVTWLNNISLEIFKGFNLNFRLDAYYDDNKTNSISDRNAVGGVNGTGKRVNLIQQLLLTYNRNF